MHAIRFLYLGVHDSFIGAADSAEGVDRNPNPKQQRATLLLERVKIASARFLPAIREVLGDRKAFQREAQT
jgi:hypothetical protein